MATPISFPDANRTLTKPEGMSDEQCQPLPTFTDGRHCISCWQLDEAELAELVANGGKVWLGVVSGLTQPPVFVQVACPIIYSDGPLPEPLPKLTTEYQHALATIASKLPGDTNAQLEHYLALKAAYEQGGQPAVVQYLQPYEAYLTSPAQ